MFPVARAKAVLAEKDTVVDIASANHAEMFAHVSHHFKRTKSAIEAYLVSLGLPKQGYTAELIMFMERSFAGKYRKGEYSHYQHIMRPSRSWKKGDTLSEKLTRCRNKETFKKRFDNIGITAKLKREHFEKHHISNLDFKGRMYFRLIDTSRNNLSRFYRNDLAVKEFIKRALDFYESQLSAKHDPSKPALVSSGNPEVLPPNKPALEYVENRKPLLISDDPIEIPRDKSKMTRLTSLTLVRSSYPTGKQPIPSPEIEEVKGNDFGVDQKFGVSICGLGNLGTERPPVSRNPSRHLSPEDVYAVWRKSVLLSFPKYCITERPTKKLLSQVKILSDNFKEHFPHAEIADFFRVVVERWYGISNALKTEFGVWQTLGISPDIPTLVRYGDQILSLCNQHKEFSLQPAQEKPSQSREAKTALNQQDIHAHETGKCGSQMIVSDGSVIEQMHSKNGLPLDTQPSTDAPLHENIELQVNVKTPEEMATLIKAKMKAKLEAKKHS